MARAAVGLSAAAIALAACSLFTSLDGLSAGGAAPADALVDSSSVVESDAAPSEAGNDGGGVACATDGGTPMIDVGTHCVDAKEVTKAEYGAFLASTVSPAMPASCGYRTSHVPTGDWPPAAGAGSLPVGYIDWCDAYAYCAWRGKRLCGRVGGGALAPAEIGTAVDEWYVACSADGARKFPYGDAFAATTCNGADAGVGYVAPVGSFAQCEGGYPGLFDMSGNVFEISDACEASTGAGDQCYIRGGSFESTTSDSLSCAHLGTVGRSSKFSDLGIRCCRDR